MSTSDSLSAKVWITPEEFEMGVIKFIDGDVIAEFVSGKMVSGNGLNIFYEPVTRIRRNKHGTSVSEKFDSRLSVRLKPSLSIRHPYADHGVQFIEDVFPHSTDGFYGRLQAGKGEALYIVQPIRNSERYWLTIVNPQTGHIHETHVIQSYEAESLSLTEDSMRALYRKSSTNREKTRKDIFSILDSPSPSWLELENIISDVYIPNLELGETMKDTFTQIVPSSFPTEIREELMVFLAYVIESKVPKEDPLEYLHKFSSMVVLENLVSNHLMHVLDGTKWPPYVKMMILSERGQLDPPKRAVSDAIINTPWLLFGQKCAEMRPNWLNIAIDSAKTITESKKVTIGLATPASATKRSRPLWKKRFTEITHGLRVRGDINYTPLGLAEFVYYGAAYRWPHKHMKFISRLGGAGENTPHLQIMVMPISVLERVKRALPSVLTVDWSARLLNYNLFDRESNRWDIPIDKIIESLETRSSVPKLKEEFNESEYIGEYKISSREARAMDLLAEGIESFYLEVPEFLNNWGLSKKQVKNTVTNLVNKKIMKISYDISNPRLVSLAIILQGNKGAITSLVSAFLKFTPSSLVKLNKDGNEGIIISRIPEDSMYHLASQLTSQGIENDVNIRCMRPTTFRRFTSNLYQRILREDGTWDDDVSAFLSQARSKRKELSESNA